MLEIIYSIDRAKKVLKDSMTDFSREYLKWVSKVQMFPRQGGFGESENLSWIWLAISARSKEKAGEPLIVYQARFV